MTESLLDMCDSVRGCIKLGVLAINTVLLLMGIASVAAGVWLLTSEDSFFHRYHEIIADSDVNQDLLKHGVIVLLAGGLAVVTLTLLGMMAALTSNTLMLALYCVLLSVLMVVEVVPVTLAVIFKADWSSKIDIEAKKAFLNRYGEPPRPGKADFTEAFDALQTEYECCGWRNGSDYFSEDLKPKNWSKNILDSNNTLMVVPEACCPTTNHSLLHQCLRDPENATEAFVTLGCGEAMTDILTMHQALVMSLCVLVLISEILSLSASVTLLSFKVHKYDLSS